MGLCWDAHQHKPVTLAETGFGGDLWRTESEPPALFTTLSKPDDRTHYPYYLFFPYLRSFKRRDAPCSLTLVRVQVNTF
jgi:hypothetical protein